MLFPGRRYANGATARRLARDTWEVELPDREPARLSFREMPYTCENAWGVLIDTSRRRHTSRQSTEWILHTSTGERVANARPTTRSWAARDPAAIAAAADTNRRGVRMLRAYAASSSGSRNHPRSLTRPTP